MTHTPLILAALPVLVALLFWAIIDLERFVLYVLLPSSIFPGTLAQPGGVNVALVDVMLVIALVSWLINNSIGNAPDPCVRRNWLCVAGVGFAGLQWVSLIWTDDPRNTVSFAIQGIELFVLFPLLLASLPRDVARIRRGLNVYLLLSLAMGVALVAVYLTSGHARLNGTYLPGVSKNAAGSFEAVGVVLATAFVLRTGRARRWTGAVGLIDLAGLGASESRGAMLGAVAGVLLVSVLLGRGRIAFVCTIALMGALYFAVVAPNEHMKTSKAGSYSSATIRRVIWSDAWHKIEATPFVGTGGGTYFDPPTGQTDPNNTILLTWAEDGIPGLILFGGLIGAFAATARRTLRSRGPDVRLMAIAVSGGVVTLLVHFEIDVTWARGAASLMMCLMGLTVALWRISRSSEVPSMKVQSPQNEPAPVLV
jgi:O-antigen ligase